MIAIRSARSAPAASITARTSSTCSSSVAVPPVRSDIPVPRRSKRITRPSPPSRAKKRATVGWSQSDSTAENVCGTKTMSRSPSPSTWKAIETPSRARTYWVLGATDQQPTDRGRAAPKAQFPGIWKVELPCSAGTAHNMARTSA